jgi:hypothetical protein
MAPRLVHWDRLVRYTGTAGAEIRYGEPNVDDTQIGKIAELARQGKLQVNVFEGDDVFSVQRTGRTETVGHLLGPLTVREVPIVRCIGLNYKSHSKQHAGLRNSGRAKLNTAQSSKQADLFLHVQLFSPNQGLL